MNIWSAWSYNSDEMCLFFIFIFLSNTMCLLYVTRKSNHFMGDWALRVQQGENWMLYWSLTMLDTSISCSRGWGQWLKYVEPRWAAPCSILEPAYPPPLIPTLHPDKKKKDTSISISSAFLYFFLVWKNYLEFAKYQLI